MALHAVTPVFPTLSLVFVPDTKKECKALHEVETPRDLLQHTFTKTTSVLSTARPFEIHTDLNHHYKNTLQQRD